MTSTATGWRLTALLVVRFWEISVLQMLPVKPAVDETVTLLTLSLHPY